MVDEFLRKENYKNKILFYYAVARNKIRSWSKTNLLSLDIYKVVLCRKPPSRFCRFPFEIVVAAQIIHVFSTMFCVCRRRETEAENIIRSHARPPNPYRSCSLFFRFFYTHFLKVFKTLSPDNARKNVKRRNRIKQKTVFTFFQMKLKLSGNWISIVRGKGSSIVRGKGPSCCQKPIRIFLKKSEHDRCLASEFSNGFVRELYMEKHWIICARKSFLLRKLAKKRKRFLANKKKNNFSKFYWKFP